MIILNNHYMLVGKYIFVIFPSFYLKANFRGMGVGSGAMAPRILKFDILLPSFSFRQKYCFPSFEWLKCNFTTSGPSCKIILGPPLENPLLAIPCKNIFVPPLENPLLALPWKKMLPAPMFRGTCSSVEMLKGFMARESLGTPGLKHLTRQIITFYLTNFIITSALKEFPYNYFVVIYPITSNL